VKQTALQCAVTLLSRRDHSEYELIQKLQLREFLTIDIDIAIARMLENNYLCDERFAISFCRYRVNRGYGWRFIANALKQKGVDSLIIQQLVKSCEIDWYLQAEIAYNKRFGVTPMKDQKDKAKRSRFLQYRGFSTDEIITAFNKHSKN